MIERKVEYLRLIKGTAPFESTIRIKKRGVISIDPGKVGGVLGWIVETERGGEIFIPASNVASAGLAEPAPAPRRKTTAS